jgi:hypothetical protein
MQVSTHTQLLNYLASHHNLSSYCEIGLQNAANNFNKINIADKYSVDPDPAARAMFVGTSDDFFASNKRKFALYFIDGWHEHTQVERDFNNALKYLEDGGMICLHDCLPEDEITTCVPRGDQKMWHGDVYKWAMKVYSNYQDVDFVTYSFDNGCMVCWKSQRQPGPPFTLLGTNFWDFYKENREAYMKVRDVVKESDFFW